MPRREHRSTRTMGDTLTEHASCSHRWNLRSENVEHGTPTGSGSRMSRQADREEGQAAWREQDAFKSEGQQAERPGKERVP